ncbi:MAG TPA: NRDE family protein [Acidothermaceae bacterium]
MCTVVCRWRPDEQWPVQILALRDELASRAFDLPDQWWPQQPAVVGGRDRAAGGTWCASDPATAVSAVVLNRPEPRLAAAGAPSRGMLPLAAVRYQERWPEYLDVKGMAGFNLVLVTPGQARWWWFDGEEMQGARLRPGVSMFTPRGERADVDPRLLTGAARLVDPVATASEVWRDWLPVVEEAEPTADPNALIVRKPVGDDSYETVFAQFIASAPGRLRLDYLPHPASGHTVGWTTRRWPA